MKTFIERLMTMLIVTMRLWCDSSNAYLSSNIKSLVFKKVPDQKPSESSSYIKEVSSLIMCSALCNKRENCNGFGFQGPPKTENAQCEIFENEFLEYVNENDENYQFYERIVEEPDKFVLVPEKLDWFSAHDYCIVEHKGVLAKISNQQIQDELVTMITNNTEVNYKMDGVWVGLNSLECATSEPEENFKWSDGMALKKGDFKNWAKSEPSPPILGIDTDKCVALGTSKSDPNQLGNWYDAAGVTSKYPFICQLTKQQYFLLKIPRKFEKAKEICSPEKGLRLVVISDENTQKKIERYLSNFEREYNVWIGLEGRDNKEFWVDDSEVTYNKWAEDEPSYPSNGEQKICIILTPDNTWASKSCGASLRAPAVAKPLCEKFPI